VCSSDLICPIYIDGKHAVTLRGTYEELSVEFQRIVDSYIEGKYSKVESRR